MPFSHSSQDSLSIVPDHVATRWASPENWDAAPGAGGTANETRKGSPCFDLAAGATRVLASATGTSGTVRRIWMTLWSLRRGEEARQAAALRGLRLRCFWDGAATPAIDVPLGDFFCQGLGQATAFENGLFSNPEGRSLISLLPMPFRSAMRIELVNETAIAQNLYYDIDFTVGERHDPAVCYLHAHWRRERKTTLLRDFEFLPEVAGRGRLLGVCVSVIPDTANYVHSWWGEGELKAYIDDDRALPTLCGTGTEDYIGTGWGQGRYAHQWQGCPIADEQRFRYAFYRLHAPDPIWFQQRIRVTMQQIGFYDSAQLNHIRTRDVPFADLHHRPVDLTKPIDPQLRGLFERQGDDWACCTWFYLNRPENGLPELAPVGERIGGLDPAYP